MIGPGHGTCLCGAPDCRKCHPDGCVLLEPCNKCNALTDTDLLKGGVCEACAADENEPEEATVKNEFEDGDVVQIATEWRDVGDEHRLYWVKEANGDRLTLEQLGSGMVIPPTSTVKAVMVEWPSPDHVERCLNLR